MDEIELNKRDRENLRIALDLIEGTEFWRDYAMDDYDWTLHRAARSLRDTLAGKWWV